MRCSVLVSRVEFECGLVDLVGSTEEVNPSELVAAIVLLKQFSSSITVILNPPRHYRFFFLFIEVNKPSPYQFSFEVVNRDGGCSKEHPPFLAWQRFEVRLDVPDHGAEHSAL